MGSAHLLPVATATTYTHVMAVGTDNEPKIVVKADLGGLPTQGYIANTVDWDTVTAVGVYVADVTASTPHGPPTVGAIYGQLVVTRSDFGTAGASMGSRYLVQSFHSTNSSAQRLAWATTATPDTWIWEAWVADLTTVQTANIANDAVTNVKMANVPTNSFKGRVSSGSGDPEDLNLVQATAMLNTFTATLKGLVPPPTTATGKFLKDDGTWAAPSAGTSVSPTITYSGTAITGQLTDAGGYLRFTGTNPTFTVPPNASVAYPADTQIDGVGVATAMTIIQGAGVTVNKPRTFVTLGAKSGWTLKKVATNEWDLHGDFI